MRSVRTIPTVFAVLAVWSPLWVSMPGHAAETLRTPVVPGVELVQTITAANEPGGPQLVHTLVVDPRAKGIRLAAALGGDTVEEAGGGMEAVSRQVSRTGALAGLNADFFPFTGDPLGLAIHDGELLSEPYPGRGALGIRPDGTVVIGRPRFTGTVTAPDGATFALAGLNRKAGANELILYAPVYGAATPDTPVTVATLSAAGVKPGLSSPLQATVTSVADAPGKVSIPKDTILLTGSGPAADWLKAYARPDGTLTVALALTEPGKDWAGVREAVAGGPVLLAGGKPDLRLEDEKFGQDFSTTRHPRSAVGVTKDGKVLLVAVDGRQILSRGMALPEFAEQMRALGAVDALNLDGGGSTCLSVRGLVINSPSDGQVRRVADSLLVVADQPLGPPTETDESAPKPADAPGPHWPAVLRVTSGQSWPAPLGSSPEGMLPRYLWGTRNGGAFVSQRGVVYGYKGGPAEALALAPGARALLRWSVEVLPGPAGKLLAAWKDGALELTVRDVNNNPVQGQEIQLKQPDGTMTEVTTGTDGKTRTPAGWLKDDRAPVTVTSGVLTRQWPDPATPAATAATKP